MDTDTRRYPSGDSALDAAYRLHASLFDREYEESTPNADLATIRGALADRLTPEEAHWLAQVVRATTSSHDYADIKAKLGQIAGS